MEQILFGSQFGSERIFTDVAHAVLKVSLIPNQTVKVVPLPKLASFPGASVDLVCPEAFP